MPPAYCVPLPWGTCRWCGHLIHDPDGKHLTRRRWHQECLDYFAFINHPQFAAGFVRDRDHGICAECGKLAGHWHWSEHTTGIWDVLHGLTETWGPYCYVWYSAEFELDHRIPLWKSKYLPVEERLFFFEIGNLQTLCARCHKAKSRRDAIELAKLRKLPIEECIWTIRDDPAFRSMIGRSGGVEGLADRTG